MNRRQVFALLAAGAFSAPALALVEDDPARIPQGYIRYAELWDPKVPVRFDVTFYDKKGGWYLYGADAAPGDPDSTAWALRAIRRLVREHVARNGPIRWERPPAHLWAYKRACYI